MDQGSNPSRLKQTTDLLKDISGYVAAISAYLLAVTGLISTPFPKTVAGLTVLVTTIVLCAWLWPQITRKNSERIELSYPDHIRSKKQPAWKEIPRIFGPSTAYRLPRTRRWIGGMSLLVLAVLSTGYLGSNVPEINAELTGLDCPPRNSGNLRLVIADFAKSDATIQFENRLKRNIEKVAAGNATVCRYRRVVDGDDSAHNLGKRYRAAVVIWGNEDQALFQVVLQPTNWDMLGEEVLAPAEEKIEFQISGLEEIPFLTQYVLSEILYMEDKKDEARRELVAGIEAAHGQNWINQHPNVLAAGYFFLGSLYFDDDPFEAVMPYTEAIRLNPEYESAYLNRGHCYWRLNKFDEAITDFTTIIARNSSLAGAAYTNRGLVRLMKGDYSGAVADLIEAKNRTVVENDPYVFYDLGEAQLYAGDCAAAEQTFKDAVPYLTADDRQDFISRLMHIGEGSSIPPCKTDKLVRIIAGEQPK